MPGIRWQELRVHLLLSFRSSVWCPLSTWGLKIKRTPWSVTEAMSLRLHTSPTLSKRFCFTVQRHHDDDDDRENHVQMIKVDHVHAKSIEMKMV